MIRLEDLKLLDLLPSSITGDGTVRAMAAALDNELQSITRCVNEIVMLPRIDELPSDIVDSLAWQFHVDFYEPLGLSLDIRRALVKNALIWHRRYGTKSVLVEIIKLMFFDNFTIEEWFEYGGRPYCFRINVNATNLFISIATQKDAVEKIFFFKNLRSHLDAFVYITDMPTTLNVNEVMPCTIMTTTLPEPELPPLGTALSVESGAISVSETKLPKLQEARLKFNTRLAARAGSANITSTRIPTPPDKPKRAILRDTQTGRLDQVYLSVNGADEGYFRD